MVLLCAGFVAIVSAMAREAGLAPARRPMPRARRRGRIAGAIAAVVVGGVVFSATGGGRAEASSYARYVYKPLEATPALTSDGRSRLDAARSRLDCAAAGWTTSSPTTAT